MYFQAKELELEVYELMGKYGLGEVGLSGLSPWDVTATGWEIIALQNNIIPQRAMINGCMVQLLPKWLKSDITHIRSTYPVLFYFPLF